MEKKPTKKKNDAKEAMTSLEALVAKTNPEFVKWLKSKKGKPV